MEAVDILLLISLFVLFLSVGEISPSKIARDKMKDSILKIEKILNLNDTHYEIELDRMSDQELSELYHESKSKFEIYISERNADNNKKALEDF